MYKNMLSQLDSLSIPHQKYAQFEDEAESQNEIQFLGYLSHSSLSGSQNQVLIPSQHSTVESPPVKPKKGPKVSKNETKKMKNIKKNLLQFYGGKIYQHFKQNEKISKEERKELESLKKRPSLKKLREIFQMKGVIQYELAENFFKKPNLSKITQLSRCRNQNTKYKYKEMGNILTRQFIQQQSSNRGDKYIQQVLVISAN